MKKSSKLSRNKRQKCSVGKREMPLFSGVLINWKALSQAERVVCLAIVLIPLWWYWGWSYLILFLGMGILAYDIWRYGSIRLKSPSLIVIALVAYGFYDILINLFYGFYNPGAALSIRSLIGPANTIFSPAFIIWYVQSRSIRVRYTVVAWAFSFVVFLMFCTWAYVFFVARQASFEPPRSLFGILTGKPTTYSPGLGNSNYLIPYRAEDSSIAGFSRYFYFFHGPESLALVCAFVCLLSISLKSPLWKTCLFSTTFFVLLTSGTRSVWISLPFVIFLWFLVVAGTSKISWIVFVSIALASAVFLMIPSVTNYGLESLTGTAEAASEFRGDSTDVRSEIYRRTFEEIISASNRKLLLGHVVTGETVLPGYAPATVGSHSFYLGSLLYQRGVVGTIIFAIYWASLASWLITTRQSRPKACLSVFCLFNLVFCVMAFESVIMPLTLVAIVSHRDQISLI